VLLDTEAPTPSNAPSHKQRIDVLMRLVRALEEFTERSVDLTRDDLFGLDCESQLARLARGMKELGVIPRSGAVSDIRGLVRVFEANLNTTYVPARRFPGCAVLFQAVERGRSFECEEEPDPAATRKAWRDHVGHLECVPVRGNHMTMLKKPCIEVIAGHVSSLWGEFAGKHAGPLRPW
jgi:thioesterase domain-containing protein